MARSNNSRRGSKRGKWTKEIWSKRAGGSMTGYTSNKFSKKLTAKIERRLEKPKKEDLDG